MNLLLNALFKLSNLFETSPTSYISKCSNLWIYWNYKKEEAIR